MVFTRNLLDLWDPELKWRNGDKRITFIQIITIPFLCIGMIFTFTLDILTLPYQIRMIYNNDD